jgi:hypothetical protein
MFPIASHFIPYFAPKVGTFITCKGEPKGSTSTLQFWGGAHNASKKNNFPWAGHSKWVLATTPKMKTQFSFKSGSY